MSMVAWLVPHVEQVVLVRHLLVGAGMLNASLTSLLDGRDFGVVHLDRQGRILGMSDRARRVVLRGDVLSDRDGCLSARAPAERPALEGMLAAALPSSGAVPVGGWTTLAGTAGRARVLVHVTPTKAPAIDVVGHRVAALVLLVEPGAQSRIDAHMVAKVLGLTAAESQVAAWLAEGRTVREIADAVGCKEESVQRHLHRVYAKPGISRHVELVRLVLSLAGLG